MAVDLETSSFFVFDVALLPAYAWDHERAREECKPNLAWLVQRPLLCARGNSELTLVVLVSQD